MLLFPLLLIYVLTHILSIITIIYMFSVLIAILLTAFLIKRIRRAQEILFTMIILYSLYDYMWQIKWIKGLCGHPSSHPWREGTNIISRYVLLFVLFPGSLWWLCTIWWVCVFIGFVCMQIYFEKWVIKTHKLYVILAQQTATPTM